MFDLAKSVLFNTRLVIVDPHNPDPNSVRMNPNAKLTYEDFSDLLADPYARGFSQSRTVQAWGDGDPNRKHSGIGMIPFTRLVQRELEAEEAERAAAASLAGMSVEFNQLTAQQINIRSDTGALYSSHLWAGGPMNHDPNREKIAQAGAKKQAKLAALEANAVVKNTKFENHMNATYSTSVEALEQLQNVHGFVLTKLRAPQLRAIIESHTYKKLKSALKKDTLIKKCSKLDAISDIYEQLI